MWYVETKSQVMKHTQPFFTFPIKPKGSWWIGKEDFNLFAKPQMINEVQSYILLFQKLVKIISTNYKEIGLWITLHIKKNYKV